MQFAATDTTVTPEPSTFTAGNLVDRRQRLEGAPRGQERRQFASSYGELSEDARELALAIDSYKVAYRRRYLTFEEMLHVIRQLGYQKREANHSTACDV